MPGPLSSQERSSRIVALTRYIQLLRQEEKRLKWLNATALVSVDDRLRVAANLDRTTEKLHSAERELAALELQRTNRHAGIRIEPRKSIKG